jgi:putative endonuclease
MVSASWPAQKRMPYGLRACLTGVSQVDSSLKISILYSVYIIKSRIKDWWYVGMTANLQKRLQQHNLGQNKSTKPYLPFDIIATEIFQTSAEARKREKYLKTASGKRFLKKKFGEISDRNSG